MIAKWSDKEFKLIDDVNISKSSREVSFSDIKIGFEDCTIEDLPLYLQEIKIIEDNKTLFTGFANRCELPKLRLSTKVDRELSIELLSPRALTTKKTVTVIMTGNIRSVLDRILSPLYEDGFVINDYHIEDRNITVKFISKTTEECLNILSNKLGLYWNIDEFKKIQICDVDYLFNKPSRTIDMTNYLDEIKGFIDLTPTIEGYDYANIINIKNARVFITDEINESITLKQNDSYTFPHPVDISIATAKRTITDEGLFEADQVMSVYNLDIFCSDHSKDACVNCILNKNGMPEDDEIYFSNISTDDKDGKIFTLQMDSTFKNLATGITYKGTGIVTITRITSDTALQYSNMKLLNWNEIEKKKGKISPSGQIERVIDVKEKWFTMQELINYIRSQFTINDNYVSNISIVCDEDNGFNIGDRLEINLPELLTQGNFIITDIEQSKNWNDPFEYTIKLRNTNILENFIDLFRDSGSEEQESQIEVEYVVEYAEEETIQEKHYVELVDVDKKASTLNFELR